MKIVLNKKEVLKAVANYIDKRPEQISSIKVQRKASNTDEVGSIKIIIKN